MIPVAKQDRNNIDGIPNLRAPVLCAYSPYQRLGDAFRKRFPLWETHPTFQAGCDLTYRSSAAQLQVQLPDKSSLSPRQPITRYHAQASLRRKEPLLLPAACRDAGDRCPVGWKVGVVLLQQDWCRI